MNPLDDLSRAYLESFDAIEAGRDQLASRIPGILAGAASRTAHVEENGTKIVQRWGVGGGRVKLSLEWDAATGFPTVEVSYPKGGKAQNDSLSRLLLGDVPDLDRSALCAEPRATLADLWSSKEASIAARVPGLRLLSLVSTEVARQTTDWPKRTLGQNAGELAFSECYPWSVDWSVGDTLWFITLDAGDSGWDGLRLRRNDEEGAVRHQWDHLLNTPDPETAARQIAQDALAFSLNYAG